MPTSFRHHRVSYYLLVAAVAVVVHLGPIASLLGEGVHDLLRRNSEAYAMLLLIPLYWDIFAGPLDPGGSTGTSELDRSWIGTAAWFGSVLLGVVLLQTSIPDTLGLEIPQSIVTLGEAFTATLVISAYLGWSRGILPIRDSTVDGRAVVTVSARLMYYLGVVFVALMVEQSVAVDAVGATLVDWMRLQTEAYAAMILVPLYFDVVSTTRSRSVKIGWYAGLVAVPLAVQGGVLNGVLAEPIRFWMGTTTEAYIAAFGISAYFDFWRTPR